MFGGISLELEPHSPPGKTWVSGAGVCFSGGPRVPLGSHLDPVVHGSVTKAFTLFSVS